LKFISHVLSFLTCTTFFLYLQVFVAERLRLIFHCYFFLLVIGRLLSMSHIQPSTQERVEVLWLKLPEYTPVAELMDVYFTEKGHGIPLSTIAGAVVATRTEPNFVISVLDHTGQCFFVHLQDLCIMCRKFLIEGARTSFVVLTD